MNFVRHYNCCLAQCGRSDPSKTKRATPLRVALEILFLETVRNRLIARVLYRGLLLRPIVFVMPA